MSSQRSKNDYDNLVGGTKVGTLNANIIKAANYLQLGGYYLHRSTITIDGVNFQIVTWSSSQGSAGG